VAYARRAGDLARDGLAIEVAAIYYQQALTVLGFPVAGKTDVGLRCDLEIALGDALRRAGDDRHRPVLREAADGARALGDAERLARIVLALNPGSFMSAMGARDDEVVALAEEALVGLADHESSLRVRLMAALAVELTFSADLAGRRADLIHDAIASARRSGDRPALVRALAASLYAANDPDQLEERLAHADELVSLGVELADPEAAYWGHMHRYDARLERGDPETARADLDAMDRLAGQLHQPLFAWRVALRRAAQALLAGRLSEAEALALAAAEIGKRGGVHPSYVEGVLGLQLFVLRYDQGRLDEVEATVSEQLVAQPGLADLWRAMLALVYCETDCHAEAKTHFDSLVDGLDDLPRSNRAWLATMVYLATVAAALRDTPACRLLYDKLAPYPGRTGGGGGPSAFGAVDPALGLLATALGRFDQAEHHFSAGEDLCRRIRAPAWLARTRLEWARMLLTRRQPGDATRARELLGQALATARELGLANVERRAVEVLRDCP
jgi:tetratricopeptide (TPR) repeat protein